MKVTKVNSNDKVLAFLSKTTGYNTLTVDQAKARFGIILGPCVNSLRKAGHAIYANKKTLKDGRNITIYRLGTPTRRVVAAGVEFLTRQGQRAFG